MAVQGSDWSGKSGEKYWSGESGDFAAIEDFCVIFNVKFKTFSAARFDRRLSRISSQFSVGFLTICVNIILDFHGKLVCMPKVDFHRNQYKNCPLGRVIFCPRSGDCQGNFFS